MRIAKNLLICFGAFWVSVLFVPYLVWIFDRLTGRIIYGDGLIWAAAMGIIGSLGRAAAAAIAGSITTLMAESRKPQLWALVVVTLCLVDAPLRIHWYLPPTHWDRVWQASTLIFPALACIGAAVLVSRYRRA